MHAIYLAQASPIASITVCVCFFFVILGGDTFDNWKLDGGTHTHRTITTTTHNNWEKIIIFFSVLGRQIEVSKWIRYFKIKLEKLTNGAVCSLLCCLLYWTQMLTHPAYVCSLTGTGSGTRNFISVAAPLKRKNMPHSSRQRTTHAPPSRPTWSTCFLTFVPCALRQNPNDFILSAIAMERR